MPKENRATEILRAIDEVLRRVIRWMNDPQGGPAIPEDVGLVIQASLLTCESGDVPASCRDLAVVAIPRLHEEFRAYSQRELGKFRPESGAPGPSFWAAMKAVAIVREESDRPAVERLEPVSVLINQGVTHDQIARHIYGRRGVGPFIQQNGATNVRLIEQEAREPGSVITTDWIPTWHRETVERRQQALSARLQAFDRLETQKRSEDPASVEEMLRDGAFIQQIERAKGVSRRDILDVAQSIGITAVDGPSYHPSLQDYDFFIDDDEDESAEEIAADRQAVRSLIVELYTQPEGAMDIPEIAAHLRQLGHNMSTHAVTAIIGHWKRRQSRSPVSNAS